MKKTSGIYRIYVSVKGIDYSYVGVSKNIENRINTQMSKIKEYFNDKDKALTKILEIEGCCPTGYASYGKLATFCLFNNLTIDDIKGEVIEAIEYEKLREIEQKELDYIKKYNSEVKGFNDIFQKYTYFGGKRFSTSINEIDKNYYYEMRNEKGGELYRMFNEILFGKITGEMPGVGGQWCLAMGPNKIKNQCKLGALECKTVLACENAFNKFNKKFIEYMKEVKVKLKK